MNIVLIEVPSDTDFKNLPQDIQNAIRSVGGDFIRGIMPGTRVFADKKIINSVIYTDLTTIETMITEFGLSWVVLAMQTAMKVPQYDAQDDPIIDPETGLQVYAVNIYRPVPLSFLDYCADIDGQRPTVIPPLAKFSGHDDWILP